MKSTRRIHNPEFKAKVALAAIRGEKTIADLAAEHGIHGHQIQSWKKTLLDHASSVFEKPHGKPQDKSEDSAELLKKIGQLTIEKDFLARRLGR